MGCNDCQSPSLQGTQYCQECMPDESSVIIPDTIVPDPFLMDRNHIYLLPNGESYILNYDRTQAVKLGGSGGSSVDISSLEDKIKKAQYDDTELRNKVDELSNKEDKDTIYNDTEIKAKLKELEEKLDKKEDIPVKYHYVETDISSNRYLDSSGFGEKTKYFSTLKDTFDFSIDTLVVKLYLEDIKAYDYHTVDDLPEEDTSIEYEDREAERLAREPDEGAKYYSTGNEFIIADSGERIVTIPFLIPNGDIIHFKAKVIAKNGYITFSEVSTYLEMANTTKYAKSGIFPINAITSNSVRIKGKDFVTTNSKPLQIKVIRKRLERES